MFAIGNIQSVGVDIERICVLHNELPHAEQSRFRTRLVPKLGLYLIPDLGKLLVAAQLLPRDLRHHLLVRHAETKIASAAVLEPEHVLAHHRPAATRLPQLPRMQRRKQELLADLVHLITNDGDDLINGTLP